MKLAGATGLLSVVPVACASAQKPEPTASASAALTSAEGASDSASANANTNAKTRTAAEDWAEKKIAAEAETAKKEAREPREALDPLAMGSELEESSIPKTEITPVSQLRVKSPAELNAALGVVKSESSVEGAAQKLTSRLGKPTWSESPKGAESAKRRVWVANTGATCHRLVLEPDGAVEVESASRTECGC